MALQSSGKQNWELKEKNNNLEEALKEAETENDIKENFLRVKSMEIAELHKKLHKIKSNDKLF